MRMMPIASGSSGNCIYLGTEDTHVLFDAGISRKRIEEGLNTAGLSLKDIDAIFVTHEHIDHTKGLGVISRKDGIPIYSTSGTIEGIEQISSLGNIDVVAPSSAPIFVIVALSVTERAFTPSPEYSIIFPTPPFTVNSLRTLRITSLADTQGFSFPVNSTFTTFGTLRL